MIKAVFFDIDGTLLSHKTNSVPASAVQTLEMLREKGILTFIATGRHLPELKKLRALDGLRFDGAVSLNGQYCCNNEGVIYHCPLDRADVAVLLDYLKANPHPCILVEADRMYINFHNALVEKVQAVQGVKLFQLRQVPSGGDEGQNALFTQHFQRPDRRGGDGIGLVGEEGPVNVEKDGFDHGASSDQ